MEKTLFFLDEDGIKYFIHNKIIFKIHDPHITIYINNFSIHIKNKLAIITIKENGFTVIDIHYKKSIDKIVISNLYVTPELIQLLDFLRMKFSSKNEIIKKR